MNYVGFVSDTADAVAASNDLRLDAGGVSMPPGLNRLTTVLPMAASSLHRITLS